MDKYIRQVERDEFAVENGTWVARSSSAWVDDKELCIL